MVRLLTSVFLGVLLGTIFNDKSAPGVASIFISLSGMLSGAWMPIEMMGKFETFCRVLPYYPSVYLGRVITGATNAFNLKYEFNSVAVIGLTTILVYFVVSGVTSILTFKSKMIEK